MFQNVQKFAADSREKHDKHIKKPRILSTCGARGDNAGNDGGVPSDSQTAMPEIQRVEGQKRHSHSTVRALAGSTITSRNGFYIHPMESKLKCNECNAIKLNQRKR